MITMPEKQNPESGNESKNSSECPVSLPKLTHLQFLVLDIIIQNRNEISAQQLLEALENFSTNYRGPKFYQLMKRLESAEYIESWPQAFDVAGGDVLRTFYKASPSGQTARRLTLEFYETRIKIQDNVLHKNQN